MLKLYVALHGLWFGLYALFSKIFAYVGWPPLYAGELLLLMALVAIVQARRLGTLIGTPVGLLLGCFLIWQVSCMLPYLQIYGMDALRDGVIWGYSLFAVVVASLVLRLPALLEEVLSRYSRLARLVVFVAPGLFFFLMYFGGALNAISGVLAGIQTPYVKADEISVHLAGVSAFVWLGLAKDKHWLMFAALLAVFPLGMMNRGGMLAFLCAVALLVILQPHIPRLVVILTSVMIIVVLLAVFDVHIPIPGRAREISLDQVMESVTSVVSNSESGDLGGTKEWRLRWWSKIWDYTFNGPYFWTGKG